MINFDKFNELKYETRIVMGITRFKGEVEGSQIDSCSVLIAAPLNDTAGNAVGFGVAKIPYGESGNFDKFRNLRFPCEMECAFAQVTNATGKSKEILKDVRPIPVNKTDKG